MKRIGHFAAGSLLALAAATAHAAGLAVNASGTLLPFEPFDGRSYLEVWGVGSTSRYAQPATDPGDPFHSLIAPTEAASQAVVSGFSFASANWSFETAAAPVFVGASGNVARYSMGPLNVELAGAQSVALRSDDTLLVVSRSASHHGQIFSFQHGLPSVDGPLTGSSFSYAVPGGTTTAVDFVALLGPSAYYVNGFDLSGFTTLPVRLTAPSVMRPVFVAAHFSRFNPSADFGITPPPALSLADFDAATIDVAFDGVFGVSVDPVDFASNAAYLTARDWVQANVRQINYETFASWQVTVLQTAPVPEPGGGWMLAAGLLVLSVARRLTD